MRTIGTIGSRPPSAPPPATSATSASGTMLGASSAFQRPTAAGLSSVSAGGRGITGLASPSLSSQTTSTLMQEQDISQEIEQHGHGGGGSHGGMKMVRNLEAEEAAGNEEAQQLRKRKKLQRSRQLENMGKIVAFDENGNPIRDPEQPETAEADPKNPLGRGIWDWL